MIKKTLRLSTMKKINYSVNNKNIARQGMKIFLNYKYKCLKHFVKFHKNLRIYYR